MMEGLLDRGSSEPKQKPGGDMDAPGRDLGVSASGCVDRLFG
jgi:hypothetical protein